MARINYLNSEIMNFNIDTIIPAQQQVFDSQGIHSASKSSERIQHIYDEAFHLFTKLAHPVGIVAKVEINEFNEIYFGEGKNEKNNVLIDIYPRAEHLTLFALTLGKGVSSKIESLFQENEYPTGYMLDSIA